jgi:hypothetical protein
MNQVKKPFFFSFASLMFSTHLSLLWRIASRRIFLKTPQKPKNEKPETLPKRARLLPGYRAAKATVTRKGTPGEYKLWRTQTHGRSF